MPGAIARYCTRCGRELSGQERFCPQCGMPRHEHGASYGPYVQGPHPNGPTYPGMNTSDGAMYRPIGPANRKKGHLDVVLVLVAIVCALLIYGASVTVPFSVTSGESNGDANLEMGDGNIEYSWKYDRQTYTLQTNISYRDYAAYLNDDVRRDQFTYDEIPGTCQTFVTSQDNIIVDISSIISAMAQERGLTREGTINLVLSFVQSLEYAFDEDTAGQDEYWRYPVETLYEGAGDCEDMSFLFASIIEAMGYDAVILLFEDHMAVGVACAGASGSYYLLDGSRYFYCETTASGWEMGRMPEEYDSAQIIQVE